MNRKLDDYKMLIEKDILLLGYEALRYAIFEGEDNNRQEYQIRIEYVDGKYEVYKTRDRASIMGKYVFDDGYEAIHQFRVIMLLTVLSNRKAVYDGEKPVYDCSLWDEDWLKTAQ